MGQISKKGDQTSLIPIKLQGVALETFSSAATFDVELLTSPSIEFKQRKEGSTQTPDAQVVDWKRSVLRMEVGRSVQGGRTKKSILEADQSNDGGNSEEGGDSAGGADDGEGHSAGSQVSSSRTSNKAIPVTDVSRFGLTNSVGSTVTSKITLPDD